MIKVSFFSNPYLQYRISSQKIIPLKIITRALGIQRIWPVFKPVRLLILISKVTPKLIGFIKSTHYICREDMSRIYIFTENLAVVERDGLILFKGECI